MTARRLSMLLLLALAGSAAGVYAWQDNQPQTGSPDRRTGRVELRSLSETITATGVIRPVTGAEVNVGSRISGTVTRLPVEIGERVARGQLLAELDATALRAQADEMRADVALSEPRLALAESTLKRREQLAEKGLTSAEDLEIARRDLAVAVAELEATRARLRSAEISLGYTRIVAPINGIVAEVSTREGETVAAAFAAPNFVTIIDLDRLEVLAYVDETDIGQVFVGQQAIFTVDTYPDAEFVAEVIAIQPRAELQGSVVNYVVRLEFQSPDSFVLRPEMTAHIQIVVEERDNVLVAPRNSIKRRVGREYVVMQSGEQWIEQNIETGWRSESLVEVLAGINEGDVLELNTH